MYSHPGASTVDHIQDNNYCEFARLTESLKHSVDKRQLLCLDCFPPNARFGIETSIHLMLIPYKLHGVDYHPCRHKRTRLKAATTVWSLQSTCKFSTFFRNNKIFSNVFAKKLRNTYINISLNRYKRKLTLI